MVRNRDEIAYRGALALSNAGASLMLAHSTDAMQALTNSLSILRRMQASDAENLHDQAPTGDMFLEEIEGQIHQVNHDLAVCDNLPSGEKSFHMPIRDLNGSSLRTLLLRSKTNIKNSNNSVFESLGQFKAKPPAHPAPQK